MEEKRDWQALAQKLAAGKPFDLACEQAGIPEEEARQYFEGRMEVVSYYHLALNEISIVILQKAARKLIEVMDAGPRLTTKKNEHQDSTDLEAAKALGSLGLNIRKLLMQEKKSKVVQAAGDALGDAIGKGAAGFMRDLFDVQGGVKGPWHLKNPNEI